MKTRREARIWVYRDAVAFTLRKHAATLKATDITKGEITPAGVERCRKEMLALAEKLEAKAAKLTERRETDEAQVEPMA
jgi:hypothetical protein